MWLKWKEILKKECTKNIHWIRNNFNNYQKKSLKIISKLKNNFIRKCPIIIYYFVLNKKLLYE